MNARRQAIEHIRNSIQQPKDVYKKIFHLPDCLLPPEESLPPLEQFLCPPPDIEGADARPRDSKTGAPSPLVLGSYRPMRSPGCITLYLTPLTQFFQRLAVEIEKALPGLRWNLEDLHELAEWVVDKTYWHERFHHSLEVLRHLYGVQSFDPYKEEALAVAYARAILSERHPRYSRRNQEGALHVIWEQFMGLAFLYTSPGYRDWILFADRTALKSGICDYLALPEAARLRALRVPVADMIFEMLPVEGGFEERVV